MFVHPMPNVVRCGSHHRIDGVPKGSLEVVPHHPVVGFQVADYRLNPRTFAELFPGLPLFVVVVRDTSMTTAVAGVKDNKKSHVNYKSTEKAKDETMFNYKFSMPNDPDRDVYLAVQLFDFSSKS